MQPSWATKESLAAWCSRSEAFWNVYNILACCVLTDSWGWGHQPGRSDLEMIWMSLWGIRESLPSHGCEGVGHGGRGGCWSRPALQQAHQAGARWRGMPCASSSQSFTAVQYQGDVKNSRAGPEQLTAGMWNEEHTSASPTSQRGSLCTVTSADETGFRRSFGLRTPRRSSSGFPPQLQLSHQLSAAAAALPPQPHLRVTHCELSAIKKTQLVQRHVEDNPSGRPLQWQRITETREGISIMGRQSGGIPACESGQMSCVLRV